MDKFHGSEPTAPNQLLLPSSGGNYTCMFNTDSLGIIQQYASFLGHRCHHHHKYL